MKHINPFIITSALVFAGAGCTQPASTSFDTDNVNEAVVNATTTNVNETVLENTNTVTSNTNDIDGETIDTSDWLTYTSEEYGFSFRYPSDWEVQKISETTLGIVSPELKEMLASGPNSIEVADLFLVINTPATEALYITNDFVDSLKEIEKSGEIKELVFSSNNSNAKFIDHNDFADTDQYNQYISINDGIITSTYSVISLKKDIFEALLASLSIL